MSMKLYPGVSHPAGALSRRWFCWPALALTAALAACGGGSSDGGPAQVPITKVESRAHTAEVDARLAQIREVMRAKSAVTEIPVVRLKPFALPKQVAQAGGALQIGAARAVEETAASADLQGLLQWRGDAAGRSVGALRFESPAASGLRLGLQVTQLPLGAVLRVQATGSGQAVEVDAAEVARTIQRNIDAGVPEQQARQYWLPSVDGADTTLEVELPAGVARASLQIAVPQLTHLWVRTDELGTAQAKVGESGSCNVDVSCTTGNDNESRAVARMVYVKDGAGYLCSGALMNDTRGSGTPYFLSANHCISAQVVASTLETKWFYRSASCGSTSVNAGVQTLRGGATLLYANAGTDTSFMRLNDAVPNGVVFAGWDSRTASGSGNIKGLHHPSGDLQKVSVGTLAGFANCSSSNGSAAFSCSGATQADGNHLVTRWSSGITEGGSSGSPLFSGSGGSFYVIGQLHGGSSSCSARTSPDVYGRFDLAFQAALKNWLAPSDTAPPGGHTPVFRFYNDRTGAHFYTNSVAERDFVIARLPEFGYEGPRFQAANQPAEGLSPVFRFYNARTGAHFYTISAAERDFVIDRLPEFKYEGPTWYAQTQPGNNASAMHRFYNTQRGAHFYTIIQGEVDFVRGNLPMYRYEGIAYYAWTN